MNTRLSEIIATDGYVDIPRNGPPGTPTTKPGSNGKPKSKGAAAGRFQVLNQFVDQSMRNVGQVAQSVWLVLYRETKPDGFAKISHNQIAELVGVKRRAVIRATRELVAAGLLEVIKRGSATGHTPSTYRIKPTAK